MTSALFTGIKHAELYAKFRPDPPDALVKAIISYIGEKVPPPLRLALDVGCGAGQSTRALAPHFRHVDGIDVSAAQIRCAVRQAPPNVAYRVCRFEQASGGPYQLVCFGQSFHWVEAGQAWGRIERLLAPGGVLALYGHWIPLPQPPTLQALVEQWLHEEQLGALWDPERGRVRARYSGLRPPMEDVRRSHFVKEFESSLPDYLGYLQTWSAFQKLLASDPRRAAGLLRHLRERFAEVLGEQQASFPLRAHYFLILASKTL